MILGKKPGAPGLFPSPFSGSRDLRIGRKKVRPKDFSRRFPYRSLSAPLRVSKRMLVIHSPKYSSGPVAGRGQGVLTCVCCWCSYAT